MTKNLERKRDTYLDDFFEDSWPSFFNRGLSKARMPDDFEKIINGRSDFSEEEDSYTIEMELPGVKKDEVEIAFSNDTVTVSWKRTRENKGKVLKKKHERAEGSFSRSFYVEGADGENIKANLENGVLSITVPKSESSKPKSISIK